MMARTGRQSLPFRSPFLRICEFAKRYLEELAGGLVVEVVRLLRFESRSR